MRFLFIPLAAVCLLEAASAQSIPADTLIAPAHCANCAYGHGLDGATDPDVLDDGMTRVIVSEAGRSPDGVVYVLVYDEAQAAWIQEDSLGHVAPSGGNISNGRIVLSSAGSLVTISDAGSVVVRRRSRVTLQWEVEKTLDGQGVGGAYFGSDVAGVQLDDLNELIVVGAQNDGDGPGETGPGLAYPFVHTPGSSTWPQEMAMEAPNAAPGEQFGAAVAVSPLSGGHPGDALALVGAPRRPFFTTQEGRALAFRRDGLTRIWTLETELTYPDGNPEVFDFGIDVALHPVPGGEPGELVALVGAPFGYTCGVVNTGVAFVYHRSSIGSWTHEDTLCSQVRRQDNRFGSALAMDAHPVVPLHGGVGVIRALVGTEPGPIPTEGHPGGADLFERTVDETGTVTWVRHAHFQSGATGSADADWYGSAVALAGPFALVGARASNLAAPSAGAVFVYGPTIVESQPEVPTEPLAGVVRIQPNPSLGRAEVVVDLEGPSSVRIIVVDVLGRIVKLLYEGILGAGRQTFAVEGLRPGVYLVRVDGSAGREASRFTVVR